MNGLRRGYRRPETSHYRELFIKKYIEVRPKRDWLGTVHWYRGSDIESVSEDVRKPLGAGTSMLILLLIIISCFAMAVMCALPLRMLTW